MVTRSTARTWNDIDKATQKAYHKSHINKTMGVAFTGYAFEDQMENGGGGVKLGFFRAQSYKVAKRKVKERERQDNGTVRATGPVLHEKGDLYKVDCAVTGSN